MNHIRARTWLLVSLLSAIPLSAAAAPKPQHGDRLVRIQFSCPRCTYGDTVPLSAVQEMLFLDEPCSLDIADAPAMHREWSALAAHQVGCWGELADGTFVTVDSHVFRYHRQPVTPLFLPLAKLHSDDTLTIVQPGFENIDQYQKKVLTDLANQQIAEMNRQERP